MSFQLRVKVKKLVADAIIPQYATPGAACFDLHSLTEGVASKESPLVCNTGLAFEIPEGHVMLIYSRSGHGFKSDTRLSNCVGVIDADYRGEVKVKLAKDSLGGILQVGKGDRIAQAMVIPVDKVTFEEVDELGSTERGAGGFGSTGA